jgi:hypothetical protein
MRHSPWITTTFFFLVFYTVGASMMDSFAMYHTWRFVGAEDFPLMHMESGKRIVLVFVLPTVLMMIFQILMFWHRPNVISKPLLWIALICNIIPLLSSAFVQIPIQIKLDHGKDPALLEWLIVSDWIRVIPAFVLAITSFLMLKAVITNHVHLKK